MAHASNNIFNDYTDFVRGVDKDNYFRTIYGAQPIASGLMTKRQHLTYFAVTALLALLAGISLIAINGWDWTIWILLGLGVFFVLFYTWPLKYIALGEVAVLLVWGPLMIGGGYYVLAHQWNWNVVIASIPYVLGVTTVIFGKHIDKQKIDKEKRIFTVPVLIGEKISRYTVLAMMILPYLFTGYLIVTKFFTPIMAIVLLAVPTFLQTYPALLKPKPGLVPKVSPMDRADGHFFFCAANLPQQPRIWDMVYARINFGCSVKADPSHFEFLAIVFALTENRTDHPRSVFLDNQFDKREAMTSRRPGGL